jgi:hypothetical protein
MRYSWFARALSPRAPDWPQSGKEARMMKIRRALAIPALAGPLPGFSLGAIVSA